MKLRRLKIHKFRNVQPGTELEFNDGYNVLLGQNGSGKTTLLRLITSVLRGDFVWLEREAFALEADLVSDGNQLALSIHHARRRSEQESMDVLPSALRSFVPKDEQWSTDIELRIITEKNETWWIRSDNDAMRLMTADSPEIQMKGIDAPLKIVGLLLGYAAILLGAWPKKDRLAPRTAPIWKLLDPFANHLIYTFRFDESLELFSAMTGRCSALGNEEYGSINGRIKQSFANDGRMNGRDGYFLPRELDDAFAHPNIESPATSVVLEHGQVPFLADVMQLLGFVGAEMKLDLLGKEVTEEQKTIEYGNLRFFFRGRDGSIVNQDHLSYGQKRLLTFFYYLACNRDIIVADELVNGLHHAWIAECIRAMGDRQVFVTSQNPILLDHLGFDSAEKVRRTFVTCRAEPDGVRDRITWGNMSKKNADAFYRAYKVGAQHVGEILRTKGFW